jgi:N-methylhydantoinase A
VPVHPGALSAYGILISDVVRDYSRTVMLSPGDDAIGRHFEALEELGRREMRAEGLEAVAARFVDMRYAGQGYELTVDWPDDFVANFHRLHQQRYGYANRERQLQVVNARVRMIASTERFQPVRHEMCKGGGEQAVVKEKQIYFEDRWINGRVYARERLKSGDRFSGPAVIVEYSATTFVPPDAKVQMDELANLVIDV